MITIKIIDKGMDDWHKKYIAICRRCKCKFECTKNDGKYQPQDYRGEGDFVKIQCPHCNNAYIAY